jgi:D-alanine-D-alanine ligase
MAKPIVIIICGGKSGEHEVSVRSAQSIESHIDRARYDVRCIGITHQGHWLSAEHVAQLAPSGKVEGATPELTQAATLALPSEILSAASAEPQAIVFPIIHGTNGEDGRLQGLLELANLPYVGPGVLGSAVCMDKVIQKELCAHHHIPQTPFVAVAQHEWATQRAEVLARITHTLTLPYFVKPANLGSSVGVSKVKTGEQLEPAMLEALRYDSKIIVEAGVEGILEVEVGVLGNEAPKASVCGSIKPKSEFYDYTTKYVTDDVEARIPAPIPAEASEQIRALAVQAFQALGCRGMARVDFFYREHDGAVFLNEINTLPGFTSISMYPKLWEKSGVTYDALITQLLDLAVAEWQTKQQLQYQFAPAPAPTQTTSPAV